MSELEPVWCVKEDRGPWHGTMNGCACSSMERIVSTLCHSNVYREALKPNDQKRQPDCEKCLSILRYRAKRQAASEDDKKQLVFF